MRTRPLSEIEFRDLVIPAFRETFQSVDAFGAPFRDHLTERLILYPVSPRLERDSDALAEAAKSVGDRGFYVVDTEVHGPALLGVPAPQPQLPKELADGLPPEVIRRVWQAANRAWSYAGDEAWWLSVDDLAPAKGPSAFSSGSQSAYISESAQWGLLVSHERHASAAGSEAFIEVLIDRLPPHERDGKQYSPRDQVSAFLCEVGRDWDEPMRWLPDHLTHIYGATRAGELIARHGLG